MEENQRSEETVKIIEEQRCHHPFWKSFLVGLMTFLGAFCAFYVVSDWHFKRMMHFPPVGKMDKMFKKEMRDMNKYMKSEYGMLKQSSNVIHLEQGSDAYRILIDLRAFDNNENNVQVSSNGNILTINGRSIKKTKRDEQISEFQQSYMFGDDVKLKEMTKEIKGNYYIITIPIMEMED